MNSKDVLSIVGNGCQYILTTVQTETFFKIASLIVSIITSIIILIFKIIDRVKEAKKDDGKITLDEIKKIGDDIAPDVENIKNNIEKLNKEE